MSNHFNIIYPTGDLTKQRNKIKNNLRESAFTCLFYGDINQTTVDKIYHHYLLPYIKTKSALLETQLKVFSEDQVIDVLHQHYHINGSYIFRIEKMFSNDCENITSNFFQIGQYSEELDILLNLMNILWEKQFSTFIKKSLPKTHYAFINRLLFDNIFYFNFVVQGNDDPKKANEIMDQAIEKMKKSLHKITEDDLYYAKENLINHKMKKDKSLEERAEKVFLKIYFNSFNFNHTVINRKMMMPYTIEKIINQFTSIFYTNVRKVSIQSLYNGTIINNPEKYYLNQSITSVITNDSNFFAYNSVKNN